MVDYFICRAEGFTMEVSEGGALSVLICCGRPIMANEESMEILSFLEFSPVWAVGLRK